MLDLGDIQGNILRGYRSFHTARFLYFQIGVGQAKAGRKFLGALLGDEGGKSLVTPAKWRERPKVATNIGISMGGLRALDLESEPLASFPPEFQEGMRKRASMLGDFESSAPDQWDDPWRKGEVHLVLMCYGTATAHLDDHCNRLRQMKPDGVTELTPPQEAAVLKVGNDRKRIEHFGFLDGISNPDVEDVPDDGKDSDTGNIDEKGRFRKVPIGEFLLGHRGEGGEVVPMPRPPLLVHNGTYLVLRKLKQNVFGFRSFLKKQAAVMARVLGASMPPNIPPDEYLAAKMMGRWKDGSPLDLYPNAPAHDSTNEFFFAEDKTGAHCPLGAHIRRANPRASLGFGGEITSRRRMIRRGIAYGEYVPDTQLAPTAAETGPNAGRGIMFLAFNASIERQFEFTQKQWLNYGDEFKQGDDSDPIAGARYGDGRMVVPGQDYNRERAGDGRMVIPGDERTGRPPFLCTGIPPFVDTKGGDYFFVPSLTGLRLLASGKVNVS